MPMQKNVFFFEKVPYKRLKYHVTHKSIMSVKILRALFFVRPLSFYVVSQQNKSISQLENLWRS